MRAWNGFRIACLVLLMCSALGLEPGYNTRYEDIEYIDLLTGKIGVCNEFNIEEYLSECITSSRKDESDKTCVELVQEIIIICDEPRYAMKNELQIDYTYEKPPINDSNIEDEQEASSDEDGSKTPLQTNRRIVIIEEIEQIYSRLEEKKCWLSHDTPQQIQDCLLNLSSPPDNMRIPNQASRTSSKIIHIWFGDKDRRIVEFKELSTITKFEGACFFNVILFKDQAEEECWSISSSAVDLEECILAVEIRALRKSKKCRGQIKFNRLRDPTIPVSQAEFGDHAEEEISIIPQIHTERSVLVVEEEEVEDIIAPFKVTYICSSHNDVNCPIPIIRDTLLRNSSPSELIAYIPKHQRITALVQNKFLCDNSSLKIAGICWKKDISYTLLKALASNKDSREEQVKSKLHQHLSTLEYCKNSGSSCVCVENTFSRSRPLSTGIINCSDKPLACPVPDMSISLMRQAYKSLHLEERPDIPLIVDFRMCPSSIIRDSSDESSKSIPSLTPSPATFIACPRRSQIEEKTSIIGFEPESEILLNNILKTRIHGMGNNQNSLETEGMNGHNREFEIGRFTREMISRNGGRQQRQKRNKSEQLIENEFYREWVSRNVNEIYIREDQSNKEIKKVNYDSIYKMYHSSLRNKIARTNTTLEATLESLLLSISSNIILSKKEIIASAGRLSCFSTKVIPFISSNNLNQSKRSAIECDLSKKMSKIEKTLLIAYTQITNTTCLIPDIIASSLIWKQAFSRIGSNINWTDIVVNNNTMVPCDRRAQIAQFIEDLFTSSQCSSLAEQRKAVNEYLASNYRRVSKKEKCQSFKIMNLPEVVYSNKELNNQICIRSWRARLQNKFDILNECKDIPVKHVPFSKLHSMICNKSEDDQNISNSEESIDEKIDKGILISMCQQKQKKGKVQKRPPNKLSTSYRYVRKNLTFSDSKVDDRGNISLSQAAPQN